MEEEEPTTTKSSRTTSPPVFRLQPGAIELLGFTLAVATARGAAVAENLDVVLASLARFTLTKLDKHELEGAASTALVQVLPEPQPRRIDSALSAVGVDFAPLASHPGVSPDDPRLASIVRDAYALVDRMHGNAVWSHHLVALAVAGDPLPHEVLDALKVSQDRMRATLRSAIARRWPKEPSAVWDGILGQEKPEKHDDTAVNWADDAPARIDLLRREALAEVLADRLCQIHKAAPRVSFLTHVDGNWGAGKSSLLNFLDDKLKDTFLVVRFNAWQQSRIGPPWWTLLTATRHAIANELGWWGKRRLRVSETYARTQRAGALYSLALLILVVTISVVAYALWPHKSTIASWSETAKAVTTIAAAVAVFWTGARVAARFLLWDSARGAELLEKSGTSPLREISSQFSWLIGKTPPSRQPSPSDQSPRPGQPPQPGHPSPPDKPPPRDKSPRPVIFFIDDLDRCDSAYVIDFLDSVQTIVRDAATPSGKNGHAAMFLVAADGAWLRTSYEGAYKDFRDAIGQPGRPLGYLFLDKIFQLSLTLPTASKAAQQTLLDKLLQVPALENPEIDRQITAAKNDLDSARGDGERVRDVLRNLPEPVAVAVSGDAAKVLADPATVSRTEHKLQKFAKLLDGNPRTTKRFVNTFTVIEAIRTLETEIIDFDTLALWSIIRVRWPEVADYLQREPAAITSIINSPASAEVSEPIRATACLPELRRVVQFPEGGPLTEELIRRCSGGALGTATQST